MTLRRMPTCDSNMAVVYVAIPQIVAKIADAVLNEIALGPLFASSNERLISGPVHVTILFAKRQSCAP